MGSKKKRDSKKKSDSEMGSSSLADQMENSLRIEEDKKDDDPLGSPISTLRSQMSSSTTRSTSDSAASVSVQNVSSLTEFSGVACSASPESSGVASGSEDTPAELNIKGNQSFRKDNFSEALSFYDKAIAGCPSDGILRCNRAAALIRLMRLGDAVRECEEAIRLAPTYVLARERLGCLLLCLGHVKNARKNLFSLGQKPDQATLQRLEAVSKHIRNCTDARRRGDWTTMLEEAKAATTSGAEASFQLFACQAEAYLKLHQLNDAELWIFRAWMYEPYATACQSKLFGMLSGAYIFFVQAQIEKTRGRFDNACIVIERAAQVDPQNAEVICLLKNMKLVERSGTCGNSLFYSGRYTEACTAYEDGLSRDSTNSILYCNRAACWFKLGQWENSLADSNHALLIQPRYTKALFRKAFSNAKLERWADAVRDYEILKQEVPHDKEVAEFLSHAQIELKKSSGEDVHNMKVGGTVELVSDLEKFRAVIMSSGVSVVLFKEASNRQCKQMSSVVDTLSTKYDSVRFLKVDVDLSPAIAAAENITTVSTFRIYKNGSRVVDMVSPTPESLEFSVRNTIYM